MNNTNVNFIESIQSRFSYYKLLGDKTIAVLNEKELHWSPDQDSSSIATIINHIVGNMLSRWTNFYDEDGEKKWRERDLEFEVQNKSKDELQDHWENGWTCLFKIINTLQPSDLNRKIKIRNESLFVLDAINRQFAHYSYHIGQMVYVAKMIKKSDWKSLSIPKNKSSEFNKEKFKS